LRINFNIINKHHNIFKIFTTSIKYFQPKIKRKYFSKTKPKKIYLENIFYWLIFLITNKYKKIKKLFNKNYLSLNGTWGVNQVEKIHRAKKSQSPYKLLKQRRGKQCSCYPIPTNYPLIWPFVQIKIHKAKFTFREWWEIEVNLYFF
jgi:hypothetical protein